MVQVSAEALVLAGLIVGDVRDVCETAIAGTIGTDAVAESQAAEEVVTEKPAVEEPAETSTDATAAECLDEILTARKREASAKSRYLSAKEESSDAKKAWEAAVEELTETIDRVTRPLPLFDRAKPELKTDAKPVVLPTVTICGGTESHGLPVGGIADVYEVKPGGLIVTAEGVNPTAIADNEYEGFTDVLALIREARAAGVSGPEAWREFVAGRTAPPAQAVNDGWRSDPLGVLNLDDPVEVYLQSAGYSTVGDLSAWMTDKGEFWAKDMKVDGSRKPAKFREKVEDAFQAFWAKHQEYCQ